MERTKTDVDDAEEDDDDFDMFNPSKPPSRRGEASSSATLRPTTKTVVKHIEDLADEEGFFRAPPGTLVQSYTICGELGKGVFSTVFLVKKTSEELLLAMKVLRANETMYKAGMKELSILREIGDHPHIVKLLDSFELENSDRSSTSPHLCLVFERMEMNLRETLNKYGQNVGLSLEGVRTFARQLCSALARLRDLEIVHADLKPDNVLVSADLRRCSLSDLGSAFRLRDPEALIPTPYLVSRYYRSPEIILGLKYGCEADVWALGATLFELFCGRVLFPGETNNDMLRLIHEAVGRIPKAMVRRHCEVYKTRLEREPHFESMSEDSSSEFRFKQHERDPVTGSVIRRLVRVAERPSPRQSVKGLVIAKGLETVTEDQTLLLDFADALEACLAIDPHHRLDPRKAMMETTSSPFFSSFSSVNRSSSGGGHSKRLRKTSAVDDD